MSTRGAQGVQVVGDGTDRERVRAATQPAKRRRSGGGHRDGEPAGAQAARVAVADRDAGMEEGADATAAGRGAHDGRERAAAATTGAPGLAAPAGRGEGARVPRLARLRRRAVTAVAVAGVVTSIVFGSAWSSLNARQAAAGQARASARSFLLALTNFDAKSVDADFARIEDQATGSFAQQAKQFFGSSIRQQLEANLASSRGQVRSLFVQTADGSSASVYGVVDQTYVNAKMSTPSADVLRVVLDLADGRSGWKVSEVTVLEGPSPTSPGPAAASGSSAPTGTGAPSGG